MLSEKITIDGLSLPLHSVNTLVVGSGAAALNAAVSLYDRGTKDVAIVTDLWGGGTSNNAGSDKQTYYKLSLAGETADSPRLMAEDLFSGGSMHGDIALCEAYHSAQAFYHLVNLGVPFPFDRYGAYVGYKTDHDARQRATSAGPLTSHLICAALARDVQQKDIPVFNHHQVISLLTDKKERGKKVIGAIALNTQQCDSAAMGFVLFNAVNVVLGSGGPAGIYDVSVYPESQVGSSGLAFEIGAIGQNLGEWQYGVASIKYRWNLSGSYQQAIPRYVSTDQSGGDERDFLNDYFPDMRTLGTAIFLKGYQWPFDSRKVWNYGSSLIDLLVHHEREVRRRRVYLDYSCDPRGPEVFSCDLLSAEAYRYLAASGALGGRPIDRLQAMNPEAVEIYREQGIDLARDYLEIAVCAQHNNGGLKSSIWWESNIKHLFPVGEVNGSHGVYRPGGAALNAGQVGGLRAVLYISKRYTAGPPTAQRFSEQALTQIRAKIEAARNLIDPEHAVRGEICSARGEIGRRMSTHGAHIREAGGIARAREEAWKLLAKLRGEIKITTASELPEALRTIDLCLTHAIYLEAMYEYMRKGGRSRGSYIVLDAGGEAPCAPLGSGWNFRLNRGNAFVDRRILEIHLDENARVRRSWVGVRPIPAEHGWFENMWRDFRDDRVIR